MDFTIDWLLWTMDLSARLIALRKQRGLSQQAMADALGMHVNQIKRYESGAAQPSLDALKKLARALHVTTDSLLFGESERGPDEELRLQFEAVAAMPTEDKELAMALLNALIVKSQVAGALERVSKPTAKVKTRATERRANR